MKKTWLQRKQQRWYLRLELLILDWTSMASYLAFAFSVAVGIVEMVF